MAGVLRGLIARGLSVVVLVTSDAHPGLVAAIAATLPGASWQRCCTHCTHYMRDLAHQGADFGGARGGVAGEAGDSSTGMPLSDMRLTKVCGG